MKNKIDCIKQIYCRLFTMVFLLTWMGTVKGQNQSTKFSMYGHIQNHLEDITNEPKSYFSLGEQDFFVTSNITERISFLGETVVRYDANTSSKFAPSIERAQIKYDYSRNHSMVVGKMHTPVNYWNDVYHHGRLFFPTIDRPHSFSYMVPLHTMGIRMQGQNIGRWKLGYDAVLGNGIASTDVADSYLNKAMTLALRIEPTDNLQFRVSYFNDFLRSNIAGAHSGHGGAIASTYKGALNYELFSNSIAYFGESWEFLNEFSYNRNQTQLKGTAHNFSNFTYLGMRVKENQTLYYLTDVMRIADNDVHTIGGQMLKFALGYKFEFSYLYKVKIQFEKMGALEHDHANHDQQDRYDIKIQFAYGF